MSSTDNSYAEFYELSLDSLLKIEGLFSTTCYALESSSSGLSNIQNNANKNLIWELWISIYIYNKLTNT